MGLGDKKPSKWSAEAREARRKKHNATQFHAATKHFPQLLECFHDGESTKPGITVDGCVVLPTFLSHTERKTKAIRLNQLFSTIKIDNDAGSKHKKSLHQGKPALFDPRLTASCLSDLNHLGKFRHAVLSKGSAPAKAKKSLLLSFDNEDELTDEVLRRKVLHHIRQVAETKLTTGNLDLRSFEGEALLPVEFKRLFRTALGIHMNERQLQLVISHFDKDGDGSIDFIEVHSQLMNPHRLTQSNKKNNEEKFQDAMTQIRLKAAASADHGIDRLTGKKKKFDLKSLFQHFDVDGDGTVTREEFLECMNQLDIDLSKFELNSIFWTLDPDKSGHLTYTEFSRAFYDRRNRQKKKPKRLKCQWTPSNAAEAREYISADRKSNVNAAAPYNPLRSIGRLTDSSSHLAGDWYMNSKSEVDASTRTNVYLHSKTAEVIATEQMLTKVRSARNLQLTLDRHERGRDQWKAKNPDYKVKKYVQYI